jgi:hypothetical protein
MIKTLLIALVLLLSGCSMHQKSVDYNQSPNMKAFENEDTYILYALYAEEKHQYAAAAGFYEYLYHYSGKNEYKYRELSNYSLAGDYLAMLERSQAYIEADDSDPRLKRFEILALIALQRYDEAKAKALALVESTKSSEDYLLVSEVYVKEQHYDTAIKYLERAYTIEYDESILDQMAVILYLNLDRKADAIAHLESHSRLHGCSQMICSRLAGFYSQQNNIEGMLATYHRLYEMDPKKEIGEAIVKIYSYQKNYLKLLVFLEENRINDPALLQLYIEKKSYEKAAVLAQELYEEEGEITYLGQSAIFLYEAAEDKNNPILLDDVMKKLKKVVAQNESGLFLNYLGYLLIDHDLDIQQGIGYVNRALKIEPTSAFYLDSLAWGYYKKNQCSKADELMQKVTAQIGSDDEEVKSHIEAIDACLKKKL